MSDASRNIPRPTVEVPTPAAPGVVSPGVAPDHPLLEPAQELYGYDRGRGYGVRGESPAGHGVDGSCEHGVGVHGEATATGGAGVHGVGAPGGSGVIGTVASGSGVGVLGRSPAGVGVQGESTSGLAGQFTGDVTISGQASVGHGLVVGTAGPGARLEMHGDIRVTGDVLLLGADCAEAFPVPEGADAEPGTVMVLADDGSVCPSDTAYDRRVAGIVSGAGDLRPGIRLGAGRATLGLTPVALAGTAYCKVDATYGDIRVGDLLTTSPTPGHAMKAADATQAFGAVLGKALRPLASGTGLVPVLVALQ
ncbi:MAG: hypothetical protein ACOYBY_10700 [Dermatophilaceae bacterium]